jgi:hypothetical protein
MTIMADLLLIGTKIVDCFKRIGAVYTWIANILGKLKWAKDTINSIAPVTEKISMFTKISYFIKPRAKLTYWLADEEVVVYVSDFQQKDKFKLIFKELETGRLVMVNSGNAINYRLEELQPSDKIERTLVEQNQRY